MHHEASYIETLVCSKSASPIAVATKPFNFRSKQCRGGGPIPNGIVVSSHESVAYMQAEQAVKLTEVYMCDNA